VYNTGIHHVFTGFKRANDSVRREVLYSSLIELRVPMKLVRPNEMCLNGTRTIGYSG
jgi:hypothetical protein